MNRLANPLLRIETARPMAAAVDFMLGLADNNRFAGRLRETTGDVCANRDGPASRILKAPLGR
jgi:hypothetical protein